MGLSGVVLLFILPPLLGEPFDDITDTYVSMRRVPALFALMIIGVAAAFSIKNLRNRMK